MTSKYGVPLTNETWKGWPLRIREFPPHGKMRGLVAANDVVLVWSGRSSVTLEGGAPEQQAGRHQFSRQSGMIDFLPKATAFDEVCWHGEASVYVSVSFPAHAIERVLGRKAAFRPDRLRTAVTDAHVVDLVQRLRVQACAGQPWGRRYVEALSLTLASYVYGKYESDAPPRKEDSALTLLQFERVKAFVDEHLAQNIGPLDLADVVGYGLDHFAQLFSRACGLSPYQYILGCRVERAYALLRDAAHSTEEVAVRSGFADQAELYAAFEAFGDVAQGASRKG